MGRDSTAWIELHQSLLNHRKTLALADALDLPPIYAMAHVSAFWMWSLDNAPDGSLGDTSMRTIARVAQWPGDPSLFVNALVNAEFLDCDEDNVLHIHDWMLYAGRLMEQRKAAVQRMRKWREQQQNVTRNERARYIATVPNRTQPNRTQPITNTEVVHKREAAPSAPVCVEELPFSEKPDDTIPDELPATATATPKVPKPANPAIARLADLYRALVQPKCRLAADTEIRRMLKTFTEEQISQAIRKKSQDSWWMSHNSHRGAPWFFKDVKRMAAWVDEPEETSNGPHRNGATPQKQRALDPAEQAILDRFAAHD